MNVSIHILLKFATSKTGRNVIGGILLFIVTVLALLATLMACMASFPRAGGNGDCGIIGGYSTKQME